jgi:hypothetical protein
MATTTPSEIAKRLWDTAIEHLEYATKETDLAASNGYTSIGELALKAAQFALNNQALLAGIDPNQFGLPTGAPPLPSHISGVPTPPIWGGGKQ